MKTSNDVVPQPRALLRRLWNVILPPSLLNGFKTTPFGNAPQSTFAALALLLSALCATAAAPNDKTLRIYVIDVEGGQATLFVTPEGESLLIDTGWPGNEGADPNAIGPAPKARDAERILAAAKDAGISRIDYVLLTHYHEDHIGGVPQLAERIPIGTFIDHGENSEPDGKFTRLFYEAYQKLLASGKYKHIVAKPGDVLPVTGIRAEIVSSNGNVIQRPLDGAGQQNPACSNFNAPAETGENPHSVGTLISFGKLRILDLGDLTVDKEKDLMCPLNRLGKVDIYIASHHGAQNSGSAALVHAIAARIAIVDNGSRKGGSPAALDIIKSSPGLLDMWQLHLSQEAGPAHNAVSGLIANPTKGEDGNYLEILASPEGALSVSISGSLSRSKGYGWGLVAGNSRSGSGIGAMSPKRKI